MFHDEEDLIKRLQQGDTAAYLQLYNQYHPLLYTYILRFIKIPELAEDILQEVFLKIWEVRERINPRLSFNGYLYRISRNLVFKQLKKMAANDELRLKVMHEFYKAAEDADNKVRWQQYQQLLKEAIGQLPPQRRKIFNLCREQGKTYDEVSAELGISRNTVKEHMVLAVKFLKEYFSRHGDIALIALLYSAMQ